MKIEQSMILLLFLITPNFYAQTYQRPISPKTKSENYWIDDKIIVHPERPYISQDNSLILNYTLTNNTTRDINICRNIHGIFSTPDCIDYEADKIKLFRRMNGSGQYDEISEDNYSVIVPRSTLPTKIPTRFIIIFKLPEQSSHWWQSREEPKPRDAIRSVLFDVDAIVILIPSRHIRVILPIVAW